jgi:glucose-1-phosphate adenylyltransferase
MSSRPRVLALVLAGGKGSRLHPLTRDRAKPAVPFGGRYRIIDFVLSNLFNSGIHAIYVLTQYKAQSLVEHVQRAWSWRSTPNDFVTIVPAQMRMGEVWYRGTADSVWQNFHMVDDFRADALAVFGADHVYKMNVRQMLDFHNEKGSIATVACIPVPVAEAASFGIIQTNADGRIIGFQEKPEKDPATIPGDPTRCLASMGNYIFDPEPLAESLRRDAERESHHDFGRNILPEMVDAGLPVFAYDFAKNRIPGVTDLGEHAYWRDVGTIEAYYEANLDLKNVVPHFNLYNWEWPILSANYPDPPSKFVFDDETRRGVVLQSVMAAGCLVAGGFVKDSVVGRNCVIGEGAEVRESVLFDNVHVGKGARIYRAIIDKNVRIADGDLVGHDLGRDALRHHVSEGGITVVARSRDTLATRSRNL